MQFANPTALWLLILAPVALALGLLGQLRRRRAVQRLGSMGVVERLYPDNVMRWRRRRIWLMAAALALLSIAAARPQYGRIEQKIRRAGVDVIIAIDTSRSMMATDVEPTRLDRAKEALRRLTVQLRGNRTGIIGFAGEAFLLCPMTLDVELASLVLQSIDEKTVEPQGTNLGRTIEVAMGAFERGGQGNRVLVLLTDGEDNEGLGLTMAQKAAEENIRIYGIGIGTERGAPVPDERGGYKELPEGGKVISKMNLESLSAIAEATGGVAYAAGTNPAAAVDLIADRIDALEKTELESNKIVLYQDRFGWFLAPALALIFWMLVTRPARVERASSPLREVVGDEATA